MKYRKFIEENFLIDEPKQGKLVPFIFNKVQNRYYDELQSEHDIEGKGIGSAMREIVLKARREGFTSLILAIFAADDILQKNPTETLVVSYKDDATDTFRKRYKTFVLSWYCIDVMKIPVEQLQSDATILEGASKMCFSRAGSGEFELAHNKAHFYCGTASARVGGRGGVVQKLLYSEAAYYPDGELMTAKEIVEGTSQQVDVDAGWIFIESTANGYGNYYEQTWTLAQKGESRYKPRFYGVYEFYTEEQYQLLYLQSTDKSIFRQEYPRTAEEAFIASGSAFFDNERIIMLSKKATEAQWRGEIEEGREKQPEFYEDASGRLQVWEKPREFASYSMGGDVAEGVDGDYSVARVIDNKTLKTVAKWKHKLSPPDEFAKNVLLLGKWYNHAYTAIEVNKDGLWVNDVLFKAQYPSLYFREAIDDITKNVSHKIGFKTDEKTRPYILAELKRMLAEHDDIWNDVEFLRECLTFVRNKRGRPEAMSGKHDDEILSAAIVYELRRNAPIEFERPAEVLPTRENIVKARLERLYGRQNKTISQQQYI